MPVQSINAVTLAVRNMALALDFYRDQVGLPLLYGDETASFSSFKVGDGYLNLVLAPEGGWSWWGRVIFHVDDVDATYQRLVNAGLRPSTVPENAPWNERHFHIKDPDGHELSFACPWSLNPRIPKAMPILSEKPTFLRCLDNYLSLGA